MYGDLEYLLNNYFGIGIEIIIIIILGYIVLFFLVRALILWYYKINKMVALQKEQNETLKQILSELQSKK